MVANRKKMTCGKCGREIDSKMPMLILQVIELFGKHIPIKAMLTFLAKCPYCCEMYGDEDSRYDMDTEEVDADAFNDLMASGVPVMKQVVKPEGQEPDEEESDEESPSRHKIGFCSEED